MKKEKKSMFLKQEITEADNVLREKEERHVEYDSKVSNKERLKHEKSIFKSSRDKYLIDLRSCEDSEEERSRQRLIDNEHLGKYIEYDGIPNNVRHIQISNEAYQKWNVDIARYSRIPKTSFKEGKQTYKDFKAKKIEYIDYTQENKNNYEEQKIEWYNRCYEEPNSAYTNRNVSLNKEINTPLNKMVVQAQKKTLEPRKLINRKNNCFFISSLQVLLSHRDLVTFYYYKNLEGKVSKAFQNFLKKYEKNETVDPEEFIKILSNSIPIMDGNEQDAHEFLVYFLQLLYCELGGSCRALDDEKEFENVKSKNFIANTYFGMQKNVTRCKTCKNENVKYEEFSILSLPLQETITKSFDEYTKCERIVNFKCEKCKECQKCTKTMEICQYPLILIIQIRRFIDDKHKDSRKVNVERIINIKNRKYKLTGLIKHHGNLNGGHYISESMRNDCWWHYDDTTVYKLDSLE
ncbi:hypothetical protein COBT_001719, partial [Conglomerata obtusa]